MFVKVDKFAKRKFYLFLIRIHKISTTRFVPSDLCLNEGSLCPVYMTGNFHADQQEKNEFFCWALWLNFSAKVCTIKGIVAQSTYPENFKLIGKKQSLVGYRISLKDKHTAIFVIYFLPLRLISPGVTFSRLQANQRRKIAILGIIIQQLVPD